MTASNILAVYELATAAERVHGETWYPAALKVAKQLAKAYGVHEAEAAGVRGTGIGCFFDDAVHGVLGLSDRSYQSIYHFTVGGPVTDPRLRTFPAYAHRSAAP